MTNNAEPGLFPRSHKAIDAVPAVEAHHQRVFFQHAIHLMAGGLQPFIGFIAGDGTPLTVTKTDEIWRVGQNEIDSIIRKAGHDMDAITLDKSGHGSSPFSNAAPVTPCRYDSRAKSGECRGGAASRSAVKKQTLAGRFDGEN
jgi:hypothetical protein